MITVLELYQQDERQLARLEHVLGILRRHLHLVQVIRLEFSHKPASEQWLAGHERAARTRVRQQLRRIAEFKDIRLPPEPTEAEWLWAARCDRERFRWLATSSRLSADAKAWAGGMLEIVEREIAALTKPEPASQAPTQGELFPGLPSIGARSRKRSRRKPG